MSQPAPEISSYQDALRYIYSYIQYDPATTEHWSLTRLENLLARLGEPHRRYHTILIAGTKGKGSTAAMCESMLRAAGYRTGLYTSPHVHSFRERIRLSGQLIPETTVSALINEVRPYFEGTPSLTIFELMTALAFVTFAKAEVDVAVLEVGLGGRLDATNVVDPTVSVLTSISYDHMQILGDTLSQIAHEKAGIIRPRGLVVSAPQAEEAMRMIENVCADQEAQLIVVDREYSWEVTHSTLAGQQFIVNNLADNHPYHLPLLGQHQIANAVTALTTIHNFAQATATPIRPAALHQGISQVEWPGRLELLHQQPALILDSAMNGDSAEKLATALQFYFPNKQPIFIIGVSSDHPKSDMLRVLLPHAQQTYVVASKHPRAESAKNLAQLAAELGYQTTPMANPAQALAHVWQHSTADDLICITGSLFLVADVREAWIRQQNLPLPPIDPLL